MSKYDPTLKERLTTVEVKIDEVHITDVNTGGNAGTDLCIDANGRICACGSCA